MIRDKSKLKKRNNNGDQFYYEHTVGVNRKPLQSIILIFGGLLLLLVVLGPAYWMFVTSFKDSTEVLAQPPTLIPQQITLLNYIGLFKTGFSKYVTNSLIVSGITVVISTLLGASAGYSLSRFDYPGKNYIGRFLLFSYLFPGVLLMVPMYILVSRLGLIDNVLVLPIIYVTFSAPFYSWLLKAFFDSLPPDLEEAALIDGATRWQAIWKIVVPLSSPGVAAAALWTFIMAWQEYMFAVVLLSSDKSMTVSVGLARWISFQYKDWGLMNAGAVISIIPVLVLFAILGRSFVSGLTAGSIK